MTKCEPRIDIPESIESVLVKCEDSTARLAMIRGQQEMADDYFREFVTVKPEYKQARIRRVG